jgi:hypothetical protein
MPQLTANLPFIINITHDTRMGGTGYVGHDRITGVAYGSDGQIKAKLKKVISERVEEGLRAAEYGSRGRVIGCADGTTLIVRYAHDQWGYSISGPGRKFAGFNTGGERADLESVYKQAMDHAAQAYGGVAWECSL